MGERKAVVFGLLTAGLVSVGYGLAPGLITVLVLLVIHGPEGILYPALTAIMSKQAPADAQGELQGGIASMQSIGMLAGTVMFTQVFGYFMQPDAIVVSPNVMFYLAAGLMAVGLGIFLLLPPSRGKVARSAG